ncbi:MAG TPA: hypothetical protein VK210_18360 [Terriglobia bacterium]|nr:hypothetical protein [Terriglobia bacterium]
MRKLLLFPLAGVLLSLAVGCKSPASADNKPAGATTDTASLYRPTSTIKDIMDSEVDPSADYMWDAVATIISEKGIEERQPRTPKEWAEIRRKSVTLVEATNLLVMPGRTVARPGEKSENPGIELSPEEINAILEKDRDTFVKHAHTLNDAATLMLKAIDAKDIMGISDAGAAIDEACESCHLIYWYPNEGKNRAGGAPSLKK